MNRWAFMTSNNRILPPFQLSLLFIPCLRPLIYIQLNNHIGEIQCLTSSFITVESPLLFAVWSPSKLPIRSIFSFFSLCHSHQARQSKDRRKCSPPFYQKLCQSICNFKGSPFCQSCCLDKEEHLLSQEVIVTSRFQKEAQTLCM